ncbi:MAG TPA: uridine diphosphate-N-acetylglucosamine-binding protein YvcK, partial [Patescibacteria group bacterium]|nr:uridine diphosphate-N-acetylglucosamine-binding protein YvcK [Patescibacteria group bacterium]
SQEWIRNVLLYRFEKGNGLKGHNLGNLILTALQDMAGSTAKALEIAEHIFRLRGRILPVTDQTVDLVIEYVDGKVIVGEDNLNDGGVGVGIKKVSLRPKARIYDGARDAILDSDVVIVGPGDFYASIMAALAVDGMKQVMRKTKAKIIYIVNLMTRANQTHGMTAKDHVHGIEQAIGRPCDVIIVNNGAIPTKVLSAYKREEEYPVENDNGNDARYFVSNVVARDTAQQSKADVLHRSLLRHDPKKLAKIIMETI